MKLAVKILSLAATLSFAASIAAAQEDPASPAKATSNPADGTTAAGDLRALQRAVEAQTKQIEALRQSVVQLSERLPAKEGAPAPPPAAPPVPPPPAENSAASVPPSSLTTDGAHSDATNATASGPQHTVAKGETLTSISKHYKISIADLQKANKITDDRKLQIGQVLSIPTSKPSEPSAKKENP